MQSPQENVIQPLQILEEELRQMKEVLELTKTSKVYKVKQPQQSAVHQKHSCV